MGAELSMTSTIFWTSCVAKGGRDRRCVDTTTRRDRIRYTCGPNSGPTRLHDPFAEPTGSHSSARRQSCIRPKNVPVSADGWNLWRVVANHLGTDSTSSDRAGSSLILQDLWQI